MLADPTLHQLQIPEAHPSAIFVREKALVVNLESIRMVIAKDMVYILTVPSPMDRQVGVLPTPDAPLVKDLMLRLSNATEAVDKSPANWSAFTICRWKTSPRDTTDFTTRRQAWKPQNECSCYTPNI